MTWEAEEVALQREFTVLADKWHNETDDLSSPTKRKNHDAYRRILSMGKAAIPYILRDLKERGGDWYEALTDMVEVTGERSPIPAEMQGDVERMNEAWFRWGKRNAYSSWYLRSRLVLAEGQLRKIAELAAADTTVGTMSARLGAIERIARLRSGGASRE